MTQPRPRGPLIVLYGATGTTGRLVARELHRRGLSLVLSGRDRGRLSDLAEELARGDHDGAPIEIRPAQVHDAAQMAEAVRGARVVVACAGPFLQVGEPVLRAAVAAGAHYLDTTGEQHFMRDTYERYDARARAAGVAAVSGYAFEVALGDWAADRAAERVRALSGEAGDEPLDEVIVGYALSQFATTAGTLQSALASLAQPGSVWHEDRWERAATGSRVRTLHFPPPFGERDALLFPSGEVVTVPRHVTCRRVEAYLALGAAGSPALRVASRVAGLVGPLVPALAASPLGALARARVGTSPPPGAERRAQSQFALVAEAGQAFHRARVSVSGSDPYGLTARIVADGAEHLARVDPPRAGVLSPSELVAPEQGLSGLVEDGLLALDES